MERENGGFSRALPVFRVADSPFLVTVVQARYGLYYQNDYYQSLPWILIVEF